MLSHTLAAIVLGVLTFAGATPPAPSASPTQTPAPRPTVAPTATPVPQEPATYAPILMYHKIGGGYGRYSISVAQFAAQMKWLKENGYQSVSVDQVAAAVRGQATLPPKPIAITFDDGWRAQFTLAKPILDEYGFKATFYLVTNYVGRAPAFMSWEDVGVLSAEGHWIGSHSVSHTPNTRLNAAQLTTEIAGSRDVLAQRIGKPITTYAYPYGATNTFVREMAQKLGFSHAVGVVSHWQQKPTDLYNLHRIEANGTYSMAAFIGWVTGKPVRVVVAPPVMNLPAPKMP